jgi:hypothetical protein
MESDAKEKRGAGGGEITANLASRGRGDMLAASFHDNKFLLPSVSFVI